MNKCRFNDIAAQKIRKYYKISIFFMFIGTTLISTTFAICFFGQSVIKYQIYKVFNNTFKLSLVIL